MAARWFSIVVNPRNPLGILSLRDLLDIFNGSQPSWKTLGGKRDHHILPLLDREVLNLWNTFPLGPRTLVVARPVLLREVARQSSAIGWMICTAPRIRRVKIVPVRGRKRTGTWKNWPVSLSFASLEKFTGVRF